MLGGGRLRERGEQNEVVRAGGMMKATVGTIKGMENDLHGEEVLEA